MTMTDHVLTSLLQVLAIRPIENTQASVLTNWYLYGDSQHIPLSSLSAMVLYMVSVLNLSLAFSRNE